ncbi:MAG: hypothetical protein II629_09030 [Ruminococcus sp.]|nr:hypothetical protein [Ruminococcus sp.]
MHKLIEYVCDELEALEKKSAKGSMSAAEIEYADKLASLKKNLIKGDMLYDEMESDGEYSGNMGGGMSYQRGNRGGQGGGSNRGGSYVDGMSYARGRGRNARRDSMGRYSSERGYSRDAQDMADQLRDLMEDAPDESVRKDIERLLRKVEQM